MSIGAPSSRVLVELVAGLAEPVHGDTGRRQLRAEAWQIDALAVQIHDYLRSSTAESQDCPVRRSVEAVVCQRSVNVCAPAPSPVIRMANDAGRFELPWSSVICISVAPPAPSTW